MDNIVDKVFILNLDRRVDRMEEMKALMKEMGIWNWERFSAIRPKYKSINPESYSGYNRIMRLNKKYVKGSIGCKLSHIEILKLAKKNNYRNILILEDDVEFNGSLNKIDIGKRELGNNVRWDIIYLGMNKCKYKELERCVFINKVESGLCTHAYIVNYRSYAKIIKILEKSTKQIDLEYQDRIKTGELQCYIIPNQFNQNSSYSDITSLFPKH